MQYVYEYNGATVTIELNQQPDGTFKARIEDREIVFSASALPSDGWLLDLNAKRLFAHCAADQEARYVHLDGVHYRLEKSENRRQRRKSTAGTGGLTAEMPGQVIDVRVVEGDTVENGQVLVVLEAMKMEIRITAPAAGIVKSVLVKTGEIVERGQRLVEIQSASQ